MPNWAQTFAQFSNQQACGTSHKSRINESWLISVTSWSLNPLILFLYSLIAISENVISQPPTLLWSLSIKTSIFPTLPLLFHSSYLYISVFFLHLHVIVLLPILNLPPFTLPPRLQSYHALVFSTLAVGMIFIIYTQLVNKDWNKNLFASHVIQIAFIYNPVVIFLLKAKERLVISLVITKQEEKNSETNKHIFI